MKLSKKIKNIKNQIHNEKRALEALIKTLSDCNDKMLPEEIQTKIYSVGKENGYKDNLRDWFKLIYEVVFGDENGPRLGFFISFLVFKKQKNLSQKKLIMFEKIRSLIFKFDPETAHDLAIKALKTNLVPVKVKNYECLKVKFLEKEIPNPIGIAAGFDKNAEVYNSLFKLGFGFVEVGTITPEPQYGNPKPRVFRLEEDEALINRLGFNNVGSENASQNINSNPPTGIIRN